MKKFCFIFVVEISNVLQCAADVMLLAALATLGTQATRGVMYASSLRSSCALRDILLFYASSLRLLALFRKKISRKSENSKGSQRLRQEIRGRTAAVWLIGGGPEDVLGVILSYV